MTTSKSLPVGGKDDFDLGGDQALHVAVEQKGDKDDRYQMKITPPQMGDITYTTTCGKFFPIITPFRNKNNELLIIAVCIQPMRRQVSRSPPLAGPTSVRYHQEKGHALRRGGAGSCFPGRRRRTCGRKNPSALQAAPKAPDDLGPVILEQKPKPLAADILLALALLFLIFTVLADFTADIRTGVVAGPMCAGMGAVFAFLGIGYILANAGKASYLHERGLRIVDRKGQRTLRYQDVTEMTFKAIRHVSQRRLLGTSQEIGLKTDETGSKPLVFRHTYKEKSGLVSGYAEGTPMNRLCNVLTGLIARRMAARLQRGESVPWTRSYADQQSRRRNHGQGGWEEVEWERIARVDVERGIFRLWVEGDREAARTDRRWRSRTFSPATRSSSSGSRTAWGFRNPWCGGPGRAGAGGDSCDFGGNGSIRVEFTPTVEDHAALTRWYYRTTPEGRKAWAGRVWRLPVFVLVIGLLVGVVNLANKDMAESSAIAAAILVGGLLLRPLLGWLIAAQDRARLSRELRARRSWHGRDGERTRSVPAKCCSHRKATRSGRRSGRADAAGMRCRASSGSTATSSCSWRRIAYGARRSS